MKIVGFLIFISTFVFSMEYYAKLEPVQGYKIKSAVSGKVVYSNEALEGELLKKRAKIIEIDNKLNKTELAQTKQKLQTLEKMLKIQEKNFQRLNQVSSKSAFEKDNQKIQVLNLESQKSDLLIKIASLEDTIKNKILYENNRYVYNISVKKDDFVSPGTLLYETKDFSKGKLEIFIPISDYEKVLNKKIFLDGKETKLTINKIYKVADSKHISSYKCEILVPTPKKFSKLVKIEFK